MTPALQPRRKNILCNLAAGFVLAYGTVSFLCFLYLMLAWSGSAPDSPRPELGLTFPHNEHGRISYFSAFQSISGLLLLVTSVPLIALGVAIGPKKNVRSRIGRFSWAASWAQDDPARMSRWGLALGAPAAPACIFLVGPAIVHALNDSGIGLTLG